MMYSARRARLSAFATVASVASLVAVVASVSPAAAADPGLVWAVNAAGDIDQGNAIAVDGAGNVYTTGYFDGTTDFDPGPGVFDLTSNGQEDVFVQKLDATGDLVWAVNFGGTSDNDSGLGIAVDGVGNVYTTGYFFGTADFDPGPGVFNLTGNGEHDAFVQKLDAAGNLVWATSAGDEGWDVAVDGAGNVYTTGRFGGTVDFDPGPGVFNLTGNGGHDMFVQKLDADGNLVWAVSAGGTRSATAFGVAVDEVGNVYTTGHLEGTADFDPGPGVFNLTSNGGLDMFVQKLDAAGNLVWAVSAGGASDDEAWGVAVDGVGDVYTTGYMEGTVDFDPGPGVFNLTGKGGHDAFVQKLDAAGNLVWAVSAGGTGADIAYGVAIDAAGNVYTTGFLEGTADFDPGPGVVNLTSNRGLDMFVQKLDAAGNLVWAVSAGGTAGDVALGVAVDGIGNVYTTGYFSGTVDFDPGPGVFNLPSVDGEEGIDVFVWKLGLTAPNQPPTADPDGPYLGAINTEIRFDGTASFDPDGDDLRFDWGWGDGSVSTDAGPTPTYSYDTAGIYDVCLTVADPTEASGTSCTSAVVYDPDGGFVTGGGWFDSPEDAYTPDPSLTGRATFGFVSKYKKGAQTPTGNTEFQFQLGELNFRSTAYDWLVATGNDSVNFKGHGSVNAIEGYRFRLWAGDGEPDTFRIKIWTEDAGVETVLYDNGLGHAIGGGDIVIQTRSK